MGGNKRIKIRDGQEQIPYDEWDCHVYLKCINKFNLKDKILQLGKKEKIYLSSNHEACCSVQNDCYSNRIYCA